jgi:hypothetical protein
MLHFHTGKSPQSVAAWNRRGIIQLNGRAIFQEKRADRAVEGTGNVTHGGIQETGS